MNRNYDNLLWITVLSVNTELKRKQTLTSRRIRRGSLQIQLLVLLNKPRYLQNKSSSRMVKFSGSFSSMYKMVYSILKRITLHVGSLSRGKCENMENPSNMNSCSSCLIIVGILVCNINVAKGLASVVIPSKSYKIWWTHGGGYKD